VAIIVLCGFTVLQQRGCEHEAPPPSAPQAAPASPTENDDALAILLFEVQAKYFVAIHDWSGPSSPDATAVYEMAENGLDTGSIGQRQRFVILAHALAGKEKARERFEQLERELAQTGTDGQAPELMQEQQEVQAILQRLYGGEQDSSQMTEGTSNGASPLSAEDEKRLEDQLGWFGRLAIWLHDPDAAGLRESVLGPAYRVMVALLVAAVFFGFAGLAGVVGLIIMTVLIAIGRLRIGLAPGLGPQGIYAETFAVWMAVFLGLQLGVSALEMDLLGALFAFFLSLAALGWPVLRGIPWSDVRQDIGWTAGRAPALEPPIGFAGYAMTLPLLVIGVVLTFLLMLVDQAIFAKDDVFAPDTGPAHPIIEMLGGRDWWPRVKILMLAVLAAPIVEETMFRGVLHRHLRDASRWMGATLSILLSGAINGFVFALIHPQGWVAIPALMSLAFGMTLVREWRQTLIPSMVIHGTSNGLVMTLVIVLFSA
jgi:membrane protease YdiL (CAAX protease family)